MRQKCQYITHLLYYIIRIELSSSIVLSTSIFLIWAIYCWPHQLTVSKMLFDLSIYSLINYIRFSNEELLSSKPLKKLNGVIRCFLSYFWAILILKMHLQCRFEDTFINKISSVYTTVGLVIVLLSDRFEYFLESLLLILIWIITSSCVLKWASFVCWAVWILEINHSNSNNWNEFYIHF